MPGLALSSGVLLLSSACGRDLLYQPIVLDGYELVYDDRGCFAVGPPEAELVPGDTVRFTCGVVWVDFGVEELPRFADVKDLVRELGARIRYRSTVPNDDDIIGRLSLDVGTGNEKNAIETARKHPEVVLAGLSFHLPGGAP